MAQNPRCPRQPVQTTVTWGLCHPSTLSPLWSETPPRVEESQPNPTSQFDLIVLELAIQKACLRTKNTGFTGSDWTCRVINLDWTSSTTQISFVSFNRTPFWSRGVYNPTIRLLVVLAQTGLDITKQYCMHMHMHMHIYIYIDDYIWMKYTIYYMYCFRPGGKSVLLLSLLRKVL